MQTTYQRRSGIRFKSEYIFEVFNILLLSLFALSCLLPFINVLAISFSSAGPASAGRVTFWPVDFTLDSYIYAFSKVRFLTSMWNSVVRVVLGVSINMLLIILTAYPLSKPKGVLKGRTILSWFFVVTMLVGGGLIPTYLVVLRTGLLNTVWSMIIPGGVAIFNMVVLLNFFRQIPSEFEESAIIDGAGDWTVLIKIFLPLSMPCLATLILFSTVGHWNDWFSGAIYLTDINKYPLATYLRAALTRPNFDAMNFADMQRLMSIATRTISSAQIMIGALPVILVYPFLQRYFVKGMMLGGLKG